MKLTKKQKSKKQEAQTSKELGGRTTIASGALVQKGDVINDMFLVECKTTEKSFYRLTTTVWNKIVKEARNSNLRLPVMRIDVNDTNSDKLSYAILREQDFTHLCYGKAVYALSLVTGCSGTSFRVEAKPWVLVNAPLIHGLHFTLGEKDTGIVQIEWNDFLRICEVAE